jgi:hypothetical protein
VRDPEVGTRFAQDLEVGPGDLEVGAGFCWENFIFFKN